MHHLITITKNTVDGEIIQTVNARELHAFLEVKSEFRNWINNRIEQYSFIEKQDFTTTVKFYRGGKLKDYYLTLDMAKELAMVERNEKGKQARQYFIECERRAKQSLNLTNALEDPLAIKKLLLESITQLEDLKSEVNVLKPKAMALENLQRHDGLFGLTEAAKILEVQPKFFLHFLQEKSWIYRRAPGSPLLPYQDKIKKGLMDCPIITIQKPDGTEKVLPSTKITTKGISILSQELQKQSIH
ncbi:antA/AntB antirepressor family protein [Bartonella sp. B17]